VSGELVCVETLEAVHLIETTATTSFSVEASIYKALRAVT
jgi:hypothetical protein